MQETKIKNEYIPNGSKSEKSKAENPVSAAVSVARANVNKSIADVSLPSKPVLLEPQKNVLKILPAPATARIQSPQKSKSHSGADTGADGFLPARASLPLFAGNAVLAPPPPKKRSFSFDFISLIQYKEPIAGLAVEEDSLTFVLYRSGHERDGAPDVCEHIPLFPAAHAEGKLQDPTHTADAIAHAWKNSSRAKTASVILSIPSSHIWITALEFPKRIAARAVEEAVRTYIDFSLPFSKSEIYVDWEMSEDPLRPGIWVVTLAAGRKEAIDPYIDALREAGVTTVAVEPHLTSIKRALRGSVPEKIMIARVRRTGVDFGVWRGSLFRFARSVPWAKIGGVNPEEKVASLIAETKKIMHFLRTESSSPVEVGAVAVIADKDFLSLFKPRAEHELPLLASGPEYTQDAFDNGVTLAAEGAALRGIIPRKDDTLMSITPVGTEEIYERARAVSFSAFFEKLAIGLGIFFVVLYCGAYFFVSFLARRAETRQVVLQAILQDAVVMREEQEKFNSRVAELNDLSRRPPRWEKAFAAIARLENPGVDIRSVSIDDPTAGVTITGAAKNPDALLQFKADVASSGIFARVEIPFSMIIAKGDIPFQFSLAFTDKNFLFE